MAKQITVRCTTHKNGPNEPWVVCIHAEQSVNPEVTASTDPGIGGQVLCQACSQQALEDGDLPLNLLKLACGKCVRERWRVNNAS